MPDQEGHREPAHHARRPMNAFLIFCKRHRSVVREKYPNLENRAITKILGEWWANLDDEEKASYTDLAKQFKDAFFRANPYFQWYKLPAPPLRTTSSRPRDTEKPTKRPKKPNTEIEKTNNNSTKVDFNKKPKETFIKETQPGRVVNFESLQKPLSMFTPGKLADEAQMGGLSSLLAPKTETQTINPFYSPPCFKHNTISNTNDYRSQLERAKAKGLARDNTIRELQNALSETTKDFDDEVDRKENRKIFNGIPNDQITNQDVIDQIVDKRFLKDQDGSPRRWSDDEKTKSGRSCKGKRYQEFMAVGGLIVNKRQKRDSDKTDENYIVTGSLDPREVQETNFEEPQPDSVETSDAKVDTDAPEPDNNANRSYNNPVDFDLNGKIRALPPLSLEKFQQKKRDNKRKKKTVNPKPKMPKSPKIANSVPRHYYEEIKEDNMRETVVGSQKRKPRKVSKTRSGINSMVSSVEIMSQGVGPEMKLATEAPSPALYGGSDLFGLATLAEVASKTSKLYDYRMEANERNASIV